ncbi:MAG: KH domain-containing protein [archaeon]|nr:KH domain-containing protein [archaeon]
MNPLDLEEIVLIPKNRVGALIGEEGKTKKLIQAKTKTKLKIDSKSGEVEIQAEEKNSEKFQKALNIVKAIGRGFSPQNALLLLREENFLEIIELEQFTGKSPKLMHSKKSRVIGSEGKIREKIEKSTGTKVSVFGKTIALIGDLEAIEKAKHAIEILLEGASHDSMNSYLQREERGSKKFEL